MNKEPVAWMIKTLDGKRLMLYGEEQPPKFEGEVQYIPLYTHPAKYCPSENNEAYEKGFIDGMAKMTESAVHRAVEGMASKAKDRFPNYESICLQCGTTIYKPAFKTLTDEEITYLAKRFEGVWSGEVDYKGFARAILRKAQEK